jgi:hormone-sensitive lipase
VKIEKIVIYGDSAGGNMALGVVFRAIKYGLRLPDGIYLAYPAMEVDEDMYMTLPSIYPSYTPSLLNSLIDTLVPFTILQVILESYI